MTIIIYKDDCLFADRASTRRNFAFNNGNKLHCNGSITWGASGVSESKAMLEATSLEQLGSAIYEQRHLRGRDEVLAHDDVSGLVWYGHLTKDKSGELCSFDWTLADDGSSVGAYSAEWENYQRTVENADPIVFCETVSKLWGLDTDLCVYVELLDAQRSVTFHASV